MKRLLVYIEMLIKMSNAAVFIDGSNLVSSLQKCNWPAFIDPFHLAYKIIGDNNLVYLLYTFSSPHPDVPVKIRREQQGYHDMLRTMDGLTLSEGWRSPPHYEEKAVDVILAINMVAMGYEGKYNTCYVITGDSDLAPAMEMIRNMGKEVVWVYFWDKDKPREERRFSYRLAQASDRKVGFRKKWAKPLSGNVP